MLVWLSTKELLRKPRIMFGIDSLITNNTDMKLLLLSVDESMMLSR